MSLLATTQDGVQIADFELGFTLEGKAVQVEPTDDGSFIIEGLAADFDIDRQEEAFEPNAFEDGLKAFMSTNPILLYHHKADTALGQVIDANLTPQGLHIKARVDAPEPGTIIADYVRKIKNGTIRAFSVGGKFYRRMTAQGPRIFKCDMAEVSVTPYPINPRTLYAVAGKAFDGAPSIVTEEDVTVGEFEKSLDRIDALLTEAEGKAAGKKQRGGNLAGGSNTSTKQPGSTGSYGTGSAQLKGNLQKGQAHPDAAPVAALLAHVQKIHTLAADVSQNAADPEVQDVANKAANSLKKHSQALHHIAARIGPLPDYYGPLA